MRKRIETTLAGGLALALVVTLVLVVRTVVSPTQTAEAKTAMSESALVAALDSAAEYVHRGEAGKAEAILREAAESFPERQDVRVAWAEALLGCRRPEEAYEQYAAALEIGPADARLEFAAGTIANVNDEPQQAIEHYTNAQTIDPTNPNYPLYLGQVQLNAGMVDEGKASLIMAARLDEGNAVIWGTLADVALRENKLEIAMQHIDRARDLQPEQTTWRLIEARTLKRKGEPEQALLVLAGLDPAQKRDPAILRVIAECYGLLQRPSDAAALYVEASTALPRDPDLALEAALWLDRAGDPERALERARHARMLGNENAVRMIERLEQAVPHAARPRHPSE